MSSTLALKLQLLQKLRTGKIEEINNLVTHIQSTTKINPELYTKFSNFIKDNK